MKNVTIIGMGLSIRDLTAEHLAVIRSADILMGGRRQLEPFRDLAAARQEITGNINETLDFIRAHMEDHRVVVLASGDPLFFGIGGRICRELGAGRVTVLPNTSAIAGAFARVGMPWGEARVVSLHGRRPWGELLDALKNQNPVGVLTDPHHTPERLARWLAEKGIEGVEMAVFEQLGAPEERFAWYSLEQAAAKTFAQPNVVILRRVEGNAPAPCRPYVGMDEAAFDHEKGLITKTEVRAVTLARLRLSPGLTLWDLGAGSGSVGIEASVLLGSGRIVAVEQDAARVDQIRGNAKKFGVYNLEVVQARLPQGLNDLPPPDRIFIGGGGRDLAAIVSAAANLLHPGGVMVVNTVLIANLQAVIDAMTRNGLAVEVVQVQICRSKALSWDRRMEALNPVWVVVGDRLSVTDNR